jgi:hypothetical protein
MAKIGEALPGSFRKVQQAYQYQQHWIKSHLKIKILVQIQGGSKF